MRGAVILLAGLIALSTSGAQARSIENARELASACQNLEKGTRGSGSNIQIPNTQAALLCWGYMHAMQDLSVLADEEGHRFMGACPPADTTLLQLIQAFNTYAKSHSGDLKGNATLAVMKALQLAYPCKDSSAPQ
jgi:hypothetical protein